mmetsp:Transcript_10811/g.32366  ORF Transcript_10811/g.32366 Transcript_10811/m.32366 type:complete len:281 (+) Transcript_10811:1049-1891(+)
MTPLMYSSLCLGFPARQREQHLQLHFPRSCWRSRRQSVFEAMPSQTSRRQTRLAESLVPLLLPQVSLHRPRTFPPSRFASLPLIGPDHLRPPEQTLSDEHCGLSARHPGGLLPLPLHHCNVVPSPRVFLQQTPVPALQSQGRLLLLSGDLFHCRVCPECRSGAQLQNQAVTATAYWTRLEQQVCQPLIATPPRACAFLPQSSAASLLPPPVSCARPALFSFALLQPAALPLPPVFLPGCALPHAVLPAHRRRTVAYAPAQSTASHSVASAQPHSQKFGTS